uniref:hypothetical protein n=1 Tax=Streptomyces adelaidensis TaxID=2796465 RepID=UPI001906E6D1
MNPLTDTQLDEIETRAASLHEYATLTDVPFQADADQLTGIDVPQMAAELRRLRAELDDRTEALASADDPTRLRWGLNDVMWGDDDTITVLLSGPDREPYWLELEPERAAVLREDLAGPPTEERDTLPAWLRRRFTGIAVPWEQLDDGEQSYWEHQAAAVRRAVARNGFKAT